MISTSSNEFYVLSKRVQASECRAAFLRQDIAANVTTPQLSIEMINSTCPPQKTARLHNLIAFIRHKLQHYGRLSNHYDLRYRRLKMMTYQGTQTAVEEACRRFTVGSKKHNPNQYNSAKNQAIRVDDTEYHRYITRNQAVPRDECLILPPIPGRKRSNMLDFWRRVLLAFPIIDLTIFIRND